MRVWKTDFPSLPGGSIHDDDTHNYKLVALGNGVAYSSGVFRNNPEYENKGN
jgi:hypothetical protein